MSIMDKLTTKVQELLVESQMLAQEKNNASIEAEHFIKSALNTNNSSIRTQLSQAELNLNSFEQKLDSMIDDLPTLNKGSSAEVGRKFQDIFKRAVELSIEKKDKFVSLDLVLLAIVNSDTYLSKEMIAHGLNKKKLEEIIENIRGGETVEDQAYRS